jgi:hypothetical protein
MDLSFKDPKVRRIIQAAFPGAKTRRPVRVRICQSYHVNDYWDGGSRTYSVFVRLSDLSVMSSAAMPKASRQVAGNPFGLPIGDIEIGEGFAVVEHSIFCGKDMGYRIVVGETKALQECAGVPMLTSS